ncbi:hypothetical protein [Anaplasma centrale]|nr:hypothetical protein [Anaplasma centrale]
MSNDTAGGGGHHSSGVIATSAPTVADNIVSGVENSSQDQGTPTGATASSAVSGGECSGAGAEVSPDVLLLGLLADPGVVGLIVSVLPKLLEAAAGATDNTADLHATELSTKASAARRAQIASWQLKQECRDIDAKYERERFAVASWWVRKELRSELRAIDKQYKLRKELSAIDINRKAYTALCALIASWQLKQELRAIDEKYRARIELQAELRKIDEKYKREIDLQRALRAAEIAWQAREELRRELRTIDARIELHRELRTIDARIELHRELRTIDARTELHRELRTIDARTELHRELRTIDEKYKPRIELQAELRAIDDWCAVHMQLLEAAAAISAAVTSTLKAVDLVSSGYATIGSGEWARQSSLRLVMCNVDSVGRSCRKLHSAAGAIRYYTAAACGTHPSTGVAGNVWLRALPGDADSINAGAHTDAQTSHWKQRLQQGLNGICSRSAGGSCTAAHPEHVSGGFGSAFAGKFQAITSHISGACRSFGTAAPSATLDDVLVAPAQQAQGAAL